MYRYHISGLALQSEQALEGLQPSPYSWRRPWTVLLRHRRRWPKRFSFAQPSNGSWQLTWPRLGAFSIHREGRQVRFARDRCVSDAAFLDLLTGPVISCLLMLDGRHPLHGSAVRIGAEAACFLGQPGAGKSTLAATFLLQGYGVIVDDLLTTTWRGRRPYVMPGVPEIRLWPGSGRRLVPAFASLPQVVPTASKRRLDPRRYAGGFVNRPVPLGCIYELRSSTRIAEPCVQPVSPQESFLVLLEHLYNTALRTPEVLAAQFQQLGVLARHVRVRRLLIPRKRPEPSQLLDVILDDLRCRQ